MLGTCVVGTGSVEWEWLPILKQPFIQTPVQFSRDPCVVGIPGRMRICMPYVVYPINSSRVFGARTFPHSNRLSSCCRRGKYPHSTEPVPLWQLMLLYDLEVGVPGSPAAVRTE